MDTHPLILANDKMELTMSATGGRFNKLVLKEGDPISPIAAIGHFLALDGFGSPSDQEQALGMPFHGEASRTPFEILAISPATPARSVTLRGTLPLAQETIIRTVEMVNGENIVYVTTQLESNLTVDRPFSWAEHATIGPPYLEKGKVVVDMPATNCRVRPYKPGAIPGHLVYDKDFKWPMAPTVDGGRADIRVYPTDHAWLDLASCSVGCVAPPCFRYRAPSGEASGLRLRLPPPGLSLAHELDELHRRRPRESGNGVLLSAVRHL